MGWKSLKEQLTWNGSPTTALISLGRKPKKNNQYAISEQWREWMMTMKIISTDIYLLIHYTNPSQQPSNAITFRDINPWFRIIGLWTILHSLFHFHIHVNQTYNRQNWHTKINVSTTQHLNGKFLFIFFSNTSNNNKQDSQRHDTLPKSSAALCWVTLSIYDILASPIPGHYVQTWCHLQKWK